MVRLSTLEPGVQRTSYRTISILLPEPSLLPQRQREAADDKGSDFEAFFGYNKGTQGT